jgi:trehalose utilization protein
MASVRAFDVQRRRWYKQPRGIKSTDKIKLAVVTGGHPFDVPGLLALLDRMPQVDYFIQDLDNWAEDAGGVWDQYDVHLFYTMHYWGVLSVRRNMDERIQEMIERVGEIEQGILVWHHALLGFPDSPTWSSICNSQNRRLRGCDAGEEVLTEIANRDHPITRGLQPWTMIDEVFLIDEAGEGSDVLLTTNNPKSMRSLGWAHDYKKARVFCYQSGHDNVAYTNAAFQTVMLRAIRWLARKI